MHKYIHINTYVYVRAHVCVRIICMVFIFIYIRTYKYKNTYRVCDNASNESKTKLKNEKKRSIVAQDYRYRAANQKRSKQQIKSNKISLKSKGRR